MDANILNALLLAGALALVLILASGSLWLYSRRTIDRPDHYERIIAQAQLAEHKPDRPQARKLYVRVTAGIQKVKQPSADLRRLAGMAWLNIGLLDRQANQEPSALRAFRAAMQLITTPPEVVQWVACDDAQAERTSPEAQQAYLLHLANRKGQALPEDPVVRWLQRWSSIGNTTDAARLEAIIRFNPQLIQTDSSLEWAHFALGKAFVKLARYADAVRPLSDAERLVPTRAETSFLLGSAYTMLGQPPLAEAAFRRTLEREPRQVEALYQLGNLLLTRARRNGPPVAATLSEAIGFLEEGCRSADGRADIWFALGDANALNQNFEPARSAYAKAAALQPAVLGYQMALAELLIRVGDRPAAIAALRQAIASDARHAPAHFQLAAQLFATRSFREAEKYYRKVLELRPERTDAQLGLGRSLYEQGRWPEAIATLGTLANLGRDAAGLYALARSYGRSGAPAKAIPLYQQRLQTFGPDVDAAFYLGCSYAQLGDWPQALPAFQQAAQQAKQQGIQRGDVALYTGAALLYVGQAALAEAALQAAGVLAPDDSQIPYLQGVLAIQQNQLEAARVYLDKAIALNANYAAAYFALGMLDEKQSAFDRAIQRYTRGLGLWPEWVWAQTRLGITQAKAGLWDMALQSLKAANQLKPDDDAGQVYLGIAQATLNLSDQALQTWEALLVRHPNNQTIKANIVIACDELARRHLDQRNYALAQEYWRRCVREYPAQSAFSDALAETYIRQGVSLLSHYDPSDPLPPAIRLALQKAMELKPSDPRPPFYLGITALLGGDPPRAIEVLRPLAQANPTDTRYAYLLGLAYLTLGQARVAQTLFAPLAADGAAYSPGLPIAQGNLAVLQGRWDEAFAQYGRSLDAQVPETATGLPQ